MDPVFPVGPVFVAIPTVIRFILFLVLFLVFMFGNYGLLYKLPLQGTQNNLALQILAISFVTILGILFMLVNNTMFVKIFENTIGYWFVQTFYVLSIFFRDYFSLTQHGSFVCFFEETLS